MIPLTVPEVRRLLLMLTEAPDHMGRRLAWSAFRRRHQAIAQRCHAARRAHRQRTGDGSPSIQVLHAANLELTDEQWARVSPLLPPQHPPTGRPANDHRTILAGILWVARTGSSWRNLPEQFGSWKTAHSRYQRWRTTGLWQQILEALVAGDPAGIP